ncbi:hypothetical protein IE5_05464 [Bacillus cereus BAG3X2-2]|nr:hypothetical protein IE5_05464 [Bacillus cereus BAG3X2-2]
MVITVLFMGLSYSCLFVVKRVVVTHFYPKVKKRYSF